MRKGDKVMLILKRHFEYWYTLLALHKLGAVAIPLSLIHISLAAQVDHPVRWETVLRNMADRGVYTFIETGVGLSLIHI